MKSVGERMKDERLGARLSREKATQQLAVLHPDQAITTKTLQRLEEGDLSSAKVLRVAALCEVYGTTLKEVAPELVIESRTLSDLLMRSYAWISETLFAPSDHWQQVA